MNALTTKMIRALVSGLLYAICWYILASRYKKHALPDIVIIKIFTIVLQCHPKLTTTL